MKQIYLDYAAATPMDAQVAKAMEPYQSSLFYNPSASYLAAKSVKRDLETARASIAKYLGARPAEIIFTAGGTEGNNLAVHGIVSRFGGSNCVVSAIEHDSVLVPAKQHNNKVLPVKPDGLVDLAKLVTLIDDETVLVSIMYANNEIGTIQPLSQIAQIVKDVRRHRITRHIDLPIYFHTDACQAGNYLHLMVNRLGVDLMSINGGKLYGPKQSGVLFVKAGTEIQPLIVGGGQERGMRSGTENVANSIGLAKALSIAQDMREAEAQRLNQLQHYFINELHQRFPGIRINGSDHRLANTIHVTFKGIDNERLTMQLDEAGVQVAVGSACSASNDKPSHVLSAIGLSDKEARQSLRLTLGRQTTKPELDHVLKLLSQFISILS